MALTLGDRRFKSTSNILNEITNLEGNSQEDFPAKNRFRTYTVKDLRQEKQYFAKNVVHERKKSRNFIRRLIGSLERKNEECTANDEFFAQYYRRNNYSDSSFNHSFDGRQSVDFNSPVLERQTTAQSYRSGGSSDRCNADCNAERLVSPVRNMGFVDSRRFPSIPEDIFESRRLEESFEWRKDSPKKRLDRKRSFKDFLGSMIKWKKSSAKETPHRFISCDRLAEMRTFSARKDKKLLSRTSSLSAIDGCQRALTQSEKPKATIRPVYGGRRSRQLSEVLSRNKENWRVSIVERTLEDPEISLPNRRHSETFFPARGPRR